jgi:MYXO-CTERM domain-containing protein
VFLRATFGVLKSVDGGAHWRWICEEAMGFSGTWDPPIAVTPTGRLYVGLERGLRYTDDGCAFRDVPELAGQLVRDLTLDEDGTVAAITGGPEGPVQVFRGGGKKAFQRAKGQIPGAVALTFEVAPSDAKRLYVTVQKGANEEGLLYRSDDGGATYQELPVALELEEGEQRGRLFVSAVDPKDRERVLVRRLSNKGSELLLSTNGGKAFRRVLRMASAMYGFSKSADGASYYAASGLDAHGVYRSTDRGEHFEPVAKTGGLCLLSTPQGVLLCENGKGAQLVSRAGLDAKTFAPLSGYANIDGALGACATCVAPWAAMQVAIAPLLTPPGPATAEAAPDASIPPGPAPTAKSADAPRAKGCSCDTTGETAPVHPGWGAPGALVFALLVLRRARRGAAETHAPGSDFTPQH